MQQKAAGKGPLRKYFGENAKREENGLVANILLHSL